MGTLRCHLHVAVNGYGIILTETIPNMLQIHLLCKGLCPNITVEPFAFSACLFAIFCLDRLLRTSDFCLSMGLFSTEDKNV